MTDEQIMKRAIEQYATEIQGFVSQFLYEDISSVNEQGKLEEKKIVTASILTPGYAHVITFCINPIPIA